jgi:atypical dual specificity phosphatase
MSYNKAIYNAISVFRNKYSLNMLNTIANIDDYNIIVNNLYLGNINKSTDIEFLEKNNIQAIINCTENEPFSNYFDDKLKLRLSINDSKDDQNIDNFKSLIPESIKFINNCINNDKRVYIHCYWGLMRSATVVACYLIKKYNLSPDEAIQLIKEQRPRALPSFYNFNNILTEIYENKDITL